MEQRRSGGAEAKRRCEGVAKSPTTAHIKGFVKVLILALLLSSFAFWRVPNEKRAKVSQIDCEPQNLGKTFAYACQELSGVRCSVLGAPLLLQAAAVVVVVACCCCCQYCCSACCLASPGSRVSVSATCLPASLIRLRIFATRFSTLPAPSPPHHAPLHQCAPQPAPVNC